MSRVCFCASLSANEAHTPTARCRTCSAYGTDWEPVPMCICGQGFPASIHLMPSLPGYHHPRNGGEEA